ncbi:MAG: hypothetical protein M3Q81_01710, partial [bacterium]|nr:hypothetical protein [bacterium]
VVQWARESSCDDNPASLLASIYQVDPNTNLTTVRYRTLGNCARGDSFEQATTLGGGSYRYEFTLPLEVNDVFVRLKPLYNDTNVLVAGSNWTLPVQYFNIRSQANNTNGDETRIVEVNRTLPTAPSILDYALYSGDTLVK